MVNEGEIIPGVCLKDETGNKVCLRDFKGNWLVLYFYPKDGTSGCTREALDFTLLIDKFNSLGAVVVGVSRDSIDSHQKFKKKYGLRVQLLSDDSGEISKIFGVFGKKKMYGKEVEGVIRSTFLVDPDGRVRRVWHNVKVSGHAQEVLEYLKTLVEGKHES
ncbi:MAG: peroxiredoxin [candidate division WOR-3 bacterium]